MISNDDDTVPLADLVDGTLSGPTWDAWLLERPQIAQEVELARRVHALIQRLHLEQIEVPDGFEARVLATVRNDVTLLQLFDLGFSGLGRALMELLELIFGLLPQQPVQPVVQ